MWSLQSRYRYAKRRSRNSTKSSGVFTCQTKNPQLSSGLVERQTTRTQQPRRPLALQPRQTSKLSFSRLSRNTTKCLYLVLQGLVRPTSQLPMQQTCTHLKRLTRSLSHALTQLQVRTLGSYLVAQRRRFTLGLCLCLTCQRNTGVRVRQRQPSRTTTQRWHLWR